LKVFSKLLFAAYLLVLLWVVFFKFSYEPLEILRDHDARGVNLAPFTRAHTHEMFANFVAFIPFGVMLGVVFKKAGFLRKLAVVFAFSLGVEIVQYILAIGITDITDLITNTLGGLAGITAYAVLRRFANERRLDIGFLAVGSLILLAVLYLRVFVFIVRY
jgi:glycopeptide antibiotics resistance protein